MIVLDTHVLIWLIDSPKKLSKKAKKVIDRERLKKAILVSSISTLEIHLLIKKDKLILTTYPDVWFEEIENLPFIKFIPVDNRIAAYSVNLPDFLHKDPADRIIAATALKYGAVLVTSDKRLLKYPHIQTVW